MIWFGEIPIKFNQNRCEIRIKAFENNDVCKIGSKIKKMAKKKLFWGCRFFFVFLMRFWMNFGSPGRPGGAPEIDFFASFFDFFARLLLQSCSWGLLGPFRVDFSTIFRRFWHDFWSISSHFFVALLSVCCASWADFGLFFLHAHAFQMFFWLPLWKKTLIRATKERVTSV